MNVVQVLQEENKIARIGYTGFRFRTTRGGTPDRLSALSRRGQGGVRLHIGEERYAMMTKADKALSMSARARLVGMREKVEIIEISASAVSQASEIIVPEMIDIPGMSGTAIMEGEVTVGLFKVGLFKRVMGGYKITGHNADKLQEILDDPSLTENALTYVSLLDAREFAARLSEKTGRKFRVQTEEEWLRAKDQLLGDNFTWTETETKSDSASYNSGSYVLRRLGIAKCDLNYPVNRYSYYAIRLVEDKEAA